MQERFFQGKVIFTMLFKCTMDFVEVIKVTDCNMTIDSNFFDELERGDNSNWASSINFAKSSRDFNRSL